MGQATRSTAAAVAVVLPAATAAQVRATRMPVQHLLPLPRPPPPPRPQQQQHGQKMSKTWTASWQQRWQPWRRARQGTTPLPMAGGGLCMAALMVCQGCPGRGGSQAGWWHYHGLRRGGPRGCWLPVQQGAAQRLAAPAWQLRCRGEGVAQGSKRQGGWRLSEGMARAAAQPVHGGSSRDNAANHGMRGKAQRRWI